MTPLDNFLADRADDMPLRLRLAAARAMPEMDIRRFIFQNGTAAITGDSPDLAADLALLDDLHRSDFR
jgi:hypothetical protein